MFTYYVNFVCLDTRKLASSRQPFHGNIFFFQFLWFCAVVSLCFMYVSNHSYPSYGFSQEIGIWIFATSLSV